MNYLFWIIKVKLFCNEKLIYLSCFNCCWLVFLKYFCNKKESMKIATLKENIESLEASDKFAKSRQAKYCQDHTDLQDSPDDMVITLGNIEC